jgi:hypothetical protein
VCTATIVPHDMVFADSSRRCPDMSVTSKSIRHLSYPRAHHVYSCDVIQSLWRPRQWWTQFTNENMHGVIRSSIEVPPMIRVHGRQCHIGESRPRHGQWFEVSDIQCCTRPPDMLRAYMSNIVKAHARCCNVFQAFSTSCVFFVFLMFISSWKCKKLYDSRELL